MQGVLLLSTEPGEIEKVLIKERNAIFKVALLALAATLLAAMLLHYSVAGPLRRLSAAAEHVSRNINARHDLPGLLRRARTRSAGSASRSTR